MELLKKVFSYQSNFYKYFNSLLIVLLLSMLVVGNASQIRNLLALVAVIYCVVFIRKLTFKCAGHSLWIYAVAFFGFYHVLHIFFLGDPSVHVSGYVKFLLIPIFFVYLFNAGFDSKAIFVGATIGGFLSLYYGVPEVINTHSRHRLSIGHNPIVLATLLLVYVVIYLELIFSSKYIVIKAIAAALIFGLIYLIVNTGVRGAYISLLFLLAIFSVRLILHLSFHKKILAVALLLILSSTGLYWASSQPAVQARYQATVLEVERIQQGDYVKSRSIWARFNAWQVAFAMIQERPLLGYGETRSALLEHSERVVEERQITYNYFKRLPHAHNEFLQVWLEYGVFALLGLILMFFALVYRPPIGSEWLLYSFLIVFILLSMTDSTFKNNILVTAFFVVGSILRLWRDPNIGNGIKVGQQIS